MVKEKLIRKRNEKAFTQKDLAEYLNISQTQYSRKEKGEVEISDEEWERISKLLETNVEEIKETDPNKNITNYFENTITSNNGSISGNYYCNVPEFLLESQKEFIEMLKKEIQQKDAEIEILKKRINELKQ
ncbi:helix-turn-helix transcriptional regulator [Chryseobacterium gallinarum]|uniref:Helix-turn-helix transcriptional regulator n=1 Tax=Chryseobacterium gallinarum TaxID=1324352 RepID=A0ABX6KTG8_CHRGL|nr:helix-turn-helix transcriptional regulator [Chryseobacterium gallinarum]QIY91897.1 helix-turn-helix transcriptional regulator [Chryseobacterium gallinarum]